MFESNNRIPLQQQTAASSKLLEMPSSYTNIKNSITWGWHFYYFSFLNVVARSIASKGKSDVKESTDSSTTIDDDEKGT